MHTYRNYWSAGHANNNALLASRDRGIMEYHCLACARYHISRLVITHSRHNTLATTMPCEVYAIFHALHSWHFKQLTLSKQKQIRRFRRSFIYSISLWLCIIIVREFDVDATRRLHANFNYLLGLPRYITAKDWWIFYWQQYLINMPDIFSDILLIAAEADILQKDELIINFALLTAHATASLNKWPALMHNTAHSTYNFISRTWLHSSFPLYFSISHFNTITIRITLFSHIFSHNYYIYYYVRAIGKKIYAIL